MYPHVLPLLERLLDLSEHAALTPRDVDVYETPEGMLASERVPEGVYVPEVRFMVRIRCRCRVGLG